MASCAETHSTLPILPFLLVSSKQFADVAKVRRCQTASSVAKGFACLFIHSFICLCEFSWGVIIEIHNCYQDRQHGSDPLV